MCSLLHYTFKECLWQMPPSSPVLLVSVTAAKHYAVQKAPGDCGEPEADDVWPIAEIEGRGVVAPARSAHGRGRGPRLDYGRMMFSQSYEKRSLGSAPLELASTVSFPFPQ